MMVAKTPKTVATAIRKFRGCSRQCFVNQAKKRRSGGLFMPMKNTGEPGSFLTTVSSQCFAFQRCHQFMPALSGAGCVGTPSIAQGRADTPLSKLTCFSLHEASFSLYDQVRQPDRIKFQGDHP